MTADDYNIYIYTYAYIYLLIDLFKQCMILSPHFYQGHICIIYIDI